MITEKQLLGTIKRVFEGADGSAAKKKQCLEALEQARTLGYASSEAQALFCVASSERDLAQYDSAWRRIEQGLHFFEAAGDSDQIYQGLRLQASILQRWGLTDRAADYYLRMIQLGNSAGTVSMDPAVLNNYADIEYLRGNHQRCLELFDRAIGLCDPENLRLRLTITLNIGLTLFKLGNYDRALAHLESLRPELDRFGSARYFAIHAKTEGQVLAALDRPDEALAALNYARTLALEGGNEFLVVQTLIALAEVYLGTHRSEQAVARLEEAIDIGERIGAFDKVILAHRMLSDELARHGETSRALAHFKKSTEIGESWASEQTQRRLDGLQVILEVENMKADLDNLAQRKQSQKKWLVASASGLVILGIFSIQLVRRYRAESRLALRIQSDHQKLQKLHGDLVQASWRELEQMRRATALGEMAAAFGHELRQPLTAIFANAQATQRCLPNSSETPPLVAEAVDDIVESARRAQEIVNRLRRLMRQGEIHRKPIDLNDVITEIETLLHKEAKAAQGLILIELAPEPLVVLGDRVQLQQVAMNLVQNGLDANRETGQDRAPLKLRTALAPEDQEAILEVEDSGPPIEDETLARMFEPYFSTKADGMGMGLVLCNIIAKAHGGAIAISQGLERGLTFRLTLDLASPFDEEAAARGDRKDRL